MTLLELAAENKGVESLKELEYYQTPRSRGEVTTTRHEYICPLSKRDDIFYGKHDDLFDLHIYSDNEQFSVSEESTREERLNEIPKSTRDEYIQFPVFLRTHNKYKKLQRVKHK